MRTARTDPQQMLKHLEADLVCAGSGNEALTLALTGDHFALCLLDVMMPVMDGFETP
jgi:CheY-like chemotaxis protein